MKKFYLKNTFLTAEVVVRKCFAKFTGKHLCLRPQACTLLKKTLSDAGVFL